MNNNFNEIPEKELQFFCVIKNILHTSFYQNKIIGKYFQFFPFWPRKLLNFSFFSSGKKLNYYFKSQIFDFGTFFFVSVFFFPRMGKVCLPVASGHLRSCELWLGHFRFHATACMTWLYGIEFYDKLLSDSTELLVKLQQTKHTKMHPKQGTKLVQNNGLTPKGEVFSFWSLIGRALND